MRSLIFLGAFALISFSLSAQTDTIQLWPDEIPGAIENMSYPPETLITKDWVRVVNVSTPALWAFPASGENNKGAAVVICPGGGYEGVAIGHEGVDVAKWFNTLGISAFVLKYRLPSDAIMKDKSVGPLQDAQEAIRYVRRNASQWGINPSKIGIMGFSAGGHLASTASTHYDELVYQPSDNTSARPDFSILIYPVISLDPSISHRGSGYNLIGRNPSDEQVKRFSNELQVTKDTPPAFLVHSADDTTVPVQNSIFYFSSLKKFNIPAELHIYEGGGHGYGMGRTQNSESFWTEACKKWLQMKDFM
ncbi:MAG: alpha/beta hydrolase [Bacteroidales bacterium]|nr:alpha/beta hydrolase [Bacteroidales bacterium]